MDSTVEITVRLEEDFYRQIDLIPKENYFREQLEIQTLQANRNSIGLFGLKELKDRVAEPIKLSSKKIAVSELMGSISIFTDWVSSKIIIGYSQSSKIQNNFFAFAFNCYGIIVEHDQNVVKSIWLENASNFAPDRNGENLLTALYTLGTNYELIIVDWNEEVVVPLDNKELIQKYLTKVLYMTL